MTLPRILLAGVRGRHLINLLLLILALALALGGYLFKTEDEGQDAGAAAISAQMLREQDRIRMLRAEISRLGEPSRIAALSRQYLNLGPLDPAHDIPAEALPRVAALTAPAAATSAPPDARASATVMGAPKAPNP